MEWLNYHHLLYFWLAAKRGSVARASAELNLAPQTLSSQIHELERAVGEKLLARQGRALALTEIGRVAFGYAEEIFATGQELLSTLRGRASTRPAPPLRVGVADVLPKLIVHRLLAPVLATEPPGRLVVHEETSLDVFLAELATHKLDLVLADAPAGANVRVRAFSHLLGECGTTFFAAPALAARCRPGFPRSLARWPVLLPGVGTTLRSSLDDWFHDQGVVPLIAGEFDDPALMNVFGERGAGVFAGPSAIARSIAREFHVHVVGAAAVRHRYYAISIERRLQHPAVVAIRDAARELLLE